MKNISNLIMLIEFQKYRLSEEFDRHPFWLLYLPCKNPHKILCSIVFLLRLKQSARTKDYTRRSCHISVHFVFHYTLHFLSFVQTNYPLVLFNWRFRASIDIIFRSLCSTNIYWRSGEDFLILQLLQIFQFSLLALCKVWTNVKGNRKSFLLLRVFSDLSVFYWSTNGIARSCQLLLECYHFVNFAFICNSVCCKLLLQHTAVQHNRS